MWFYRDGVLYSEQDSIRLNGLSAQRQDRKKYLFEKISNISYIT